MGQVYSRQSWRGGYVTPPSFARRPRHGEQTAAASVSQRPCAWQTRINTTCVCGAGVHRRAQSDLMTGGNLNPPNAGTRAGVLPSICEQWRWYSRSRRTFRKRRPSRVGSDRRGIRRVYYAGQGDQSSSNAERDRTHKTASDVSHRPALSQQRLRLSAAANSGETQTSKTIHAQSHTYSAISLYTHIHCAISHTYTHTHRTPQAAARAAHERPP